MCSSLQPYGPQPATLWAPACNPFGSSLQPYAVQVATNYDLVKHVVDAARAMGREIATPEESRQILSMPA